MAILDRETTAGSPWATRLALLAIGLAGVALVALLLYGLGQRGGPFGIVSVVRRPAPDFTMPLFGGGEVRLADLRGRPVLLNFWASWCVPCEIEMPALEQAHRKYGDRVVFLGIDVQDTEEEGLRFLQRTGVTYRNGRDLDGAISIEYGMTGVPETFFITRDGQIQRKWVGPLDLTRLESLLEELLRE